MKSVLFAIGASIALSACGPSPGNLEEIKQNAVKTFNSNGYSVVGYEGYTWCTQWYFTSYGGACVWYTLNRPTTPGVTYNANLYRWGNEYHIYGVRAIDAIRPKP